ncbi:APC family permease [Aeromicrobium massiliense]|uniref:APC family permease n=1 Tax=Aeromicrobium massiliense TaxID=1464554 RepID=UPI001C588302|nr:APC family permease [Aeromicrobium massiliense]
MSERSERAVEGIADGLRRRLGLGSAVVIGLGSMLGAGVFVALAPAAALAGDALPVALVVAALVAAANASSMAVLAARWPQSGGAYVYGREALGPVWGYLAGVAFVVGKLASCAAMALAVGAYAWPGHARVVAVLLVVGLTALGWWGVQRTTVVMAVIVTVVLVALAAVVAVGAGAPRVVGGAEPGGVRDVLAAAGVMFFAFAGYARVATLGEEVRDPARTVPRAVGIALGVVLVVYAAVAWTGVRVLGVEDLAASTAPLVDVVEAAGADALAPVVRVAAALAAGGALLALLLGVSRTVLALARDRHLPGVLAGVDARHGVPRPAEAAIAVVVALLVLVGDLGTVVGASSFGVLLYYAVANAAALTLRTRRGRRRVVPVAGLAGCLALGWTQPLDAVLPGAVVLALALVAYAVTRRARPGRAASTDGSATRTSDP